MPFYRNSDLSLSLSCFPSPLFQMITKIGIKWFVGVFNSSSRREETRSVGRKMFQTESNI